MFYLDQDNRYVPTSVTICWGKKLPKCFHKLPKKYPSQFLHQIIYYKIAQKSTIFLGYFCEQISYQELSKIAQSGHTGTYLPSNRPTNEKYCFIDTSSLARDRKIFDRFDSVTSSRKIFFQCSIKYNSFKIF